jgi:hypothetical protein
MKTLLAAIGACACLAPAPVLCTALAQATGDAPVPLRLDASAAAGALAPVATFGRRAPGTSIDGPLRAPDWWTFTLSVARDNDPGTHARLAAMPSWFLADDLEFGVELGLWGIDQREPASSTPAPGSNGNADTIALSFRFVGRWHFAHGSTSDQRPDAYDWTLFVDAGIGMLFSADDVPADGTSLNFLPTFGAGATWRVGEGDTRLIGGVRWHHVSNARITGDRNNPDFNAPELFVGLVMRF